MSPSTRSYARELACTALLAVALNGPVAHAMAERAPPLPPQAAAAAPSLKAQGGGLLRFFGLSIYDGWYWSPVRGWPHDGPYALDLHYHRNLEGRKIAERSIDEIVALGYGTDEARGRWALQMTRIFPDVRAGDRLTGVKTTSGSVRYFHNGKPIGEIADPDFAPAFFGIWLDPKSSRPDFRKKLLGAQ